MRPKLLTLVGLAALAIIALALVAVAVAKPSIERANMPSEAPVAFSLSATPPTTPSSATLRFAAVGDSVTQGDSADFAAGRTGPLSWVTYVKSPNLTFAGGWAVHGATTAQMAANVQRVDAEILVIVAGTNDVGQDVPFSQSSTNLDRIVAKFDAKRVIVSAIPPRNDKPQNAVDYNNSLRALALQRGWIFIDAPAGVRNGNMYADGMTIDGIHPTQSAAKIIANALSRAIAP